MEPLLADGRTQGFDQGTVEKHAGNEPARLAQLDDSNDRAILVQGDEGSAQSLPRRRPGSFGWGIAALHRLNTATKLPFPCTSGGAWLDCRKLARRADPPGATVPFPVLKAPRRDMCPGGLATADAP